MPADIFAKLGDIKGESLDAKHKDEIEVLSYSWGVSQSTPDPQGGAAGKAEFREISILHLIDKATPRLLRACATGEHLKEATITHRKAGKTQLEYLIIKMNDVVVTAVNHGANSVQAETGSESVLLRFGKVEFDYRPQKADGSLDAAIQFKFDLNANKVF
jgi:type VI secretion system secreted protein Hcp